ncbi:zinc finger CCCH domain-containing protein 8-like [Dromiciops gliroides]|uniref:zinc finger CCCH domain-containing protein 8-like n=1 Tax=Dromiciops gliroides TaxID=33562 RepID=UPI001CC776FE|nr:zinc finger CCCH domain-containing protein 8-like [Dromiciops gliroides]XP_043851975.1 zinc finger CCCH domain-containing protein 8-like [Dromiciops gliroides]XP_043851976.1 zinc finger CCCH domain-containing protein 8-like [Dromiciops gliroides]XP_043851977.1 zinc finger CCCH domain-containing protein 8-like [Dromiciops gliroides]XP_043851978.1 zinc finger CCCH domain-containing protein 8-like [Dromiciops gliroides]
MSSTLCPAGLVPFEDLFSRPPNPMLGASDQEGWGRLSCPRPSPGPAPPGSPPSPCGMGGALCEPPSPLEPALPGNLEVTERLHLGGSPCCDFGDLFCKPPNPMLSPNVACQPPIPAPTPASPMTSRPAPMPRPRATSPGGVSCGPGPGEARPRKRGGQGKRKSTEAGGSAAKGKQPQEEDFAQLLEQYRREREAPTAAPEPPAPPSSEGKAKKGAKRGARAAKKKKRAGPARATGPGHPAVPPAAQERPPVSQEFIEKNTVTLGSQRVCKYFLAGRCVRGEQCRLDHAAQGLKFQQLCKFYVQGYCTRGELCRFLHQEFPCKFFHTGAKCYQGDHCGFSHAPLTPETEGLLQAALAGPAPAEAAPAPTPS